MYINKTIKNILIIFAILFFLLFIWTLWYFEVFNFTKDTELRENRISIQADGKNLTNSQQKEILKKLSPKKRLTEREKKEQINILENLAAQKIEKNNNIDLLNSLNGSTSEKEQLDLLESLKK